MTWFTASLMSITKQLEEDQNDYLIFEDYYLFEANSKQEYDNKIQRAIDEIQRKYASKISDNGKSSKTVFLGIRKVLAITNDAPDLDKDEDPPTHNSILSYNFMTVKTLNDAYKYAQGKSVCVNYIDSDNENENE